VHALSLARPKTLEAAAVRKSKKFLAMGVAFAMSVASVTGLMAPTAGAVSPPGSGFTVTAGDLSFILKQIKIAEHHSNALLTDTRTSAQKQADPEFCEALVGPGPDQIPDRLTAYGLRTVDGSCNNLFPGRDKFAASDQVFPRLTTPLFRDADPITAALPVGPVGPTSYKQKVGNVVDSQPRVISNLIVDQTSTNPAAIAAAEFPVRTQGNPGLHPCTTDPDPLADPPVVGVPAGCVPSHKTLFIPNVTTDVGLSPPYNSWFTFFGQFFDHGVDQTVKSGATVFVPLKADDPLITLGPDGKPGTGDEVPASQAFMVLTRAQNQPGPDGILGTADDVQEASNTDSPWVDQSQTYTSHAAHQVFLREYDLNAANHPVSTGKLLGGLAANLTYPGSADGRDGISTWASVKKQAAEKLGLALSDDDVTNIPMVYADPYGKFIPGPARGLPQYVTTTGLVEGNLASPVPVPVNVVHFDTPFLTDIAHNADPSPQDTDNNPATAPVTPVPDGDTTVQTDFTKQPAGTYDDELLNSHFSCGDGRCNENIALSTVHQIFHSEHDRLVEYIKNVLTTDTSATGVAALPQWQLPTADNPAGWNGERLFQAARYVTEMEYQHLVFEEFGRKVQPAIRPFHVYSPDMNPAIEAEFAHAVYRFGHSMLDDDVARTNVDPTTGARSDNSIPLLTAFLNPPEFFNGGSVGTLTPAQAAGAIIMGSVDQTGNELDEFVTETLRNNLLGLPLDLPTINMTRAREAGVPPLNDVRRQIHAATNDGQLAPYLSWSDFGQHLKHPESLINFVAAYGKHPSITGATTVAAKRAAAKLIVDPAPGTDPTTIPADAADFMFSNGSWASAAGGVTITGLDDVDLWVGGLAEVTNLFGGLLGSTFNYVFQTQMEKLQDGDRLYYLNRTPGMNLRTQLEGNSFAELIERNTDGTTGLKADVFATADCKFVLANITGPYNGSTTLSQTDGSGLTPITGAGSVNDDSTTTDCDENQLLLLQPNGTIQYRAINKIDPSGINGQSVYQGAGAVNKVFGGNDNDTFWGGDGNDVIEGNGGDDVALGGNGNDIITDLSGADVEKGGPGNDALDGGIGDDIFMGGDGQDFINGGANDNEAFAGPGNDFVIAGQGADAVFGDGGDDWIEGGSGQDLLQGDHGAPFFDDPAETAPGNDIFVGQVGENDYDAEGGDDVMAQNAAVDRNAGAGGFDWAFHQYDTVGADDDMEINNNLVGVPIQVVVNRDRWQETEANSGSAFNDVIKGTSVAPSTIGGAGFTGCDALDAAGVARIGGLNQLVTTFPSPLAPIVAASAAGACPLNGGSGAGNVWAEGDILLGGLGTDTITGRGANDIIDGDRALTVRISVRSNPADPASEIGSTDLMENQYQRDSAGSLTGPTLQAAVFAGNVDPGNLVAVREIVTPTAPAADCPAPTLATTASLNCDTSVFLGPRASYTVTGTTATAITVNQTGAAVAPQKVSDGVDTLRNVEKLLFTNANGTTAPFIVVHSAPTAVSAASTATGAATVTWTAPASNTGLAATNGRITSYQIVATPTTGAPITKTSNSATATSFNFTGLTNGTNYTFQVRAVNAFGAGPLSSSSGQVTPVGVPGTTTGVVATRGNAQASLTWVAPTTDGGSPITGYNVQVRTGTTVVRTENLTGNGTTATMTNLNNGTAYNFRVQAVNAIGAGPLSPASTAVTPATVPNAPVIGTPTQGAVGGTLTANALWSAPIAPPTPANGGSAILSYTITAYNAATGVVLQTVAVGGNIPAAGRSFIFGSTAPVQFDVVANNAIGASVASAKSIAVTPR
jgi:Ca2+-binding RTX toxin-like protein